MRLAPRWLAKGLEAQCKEPLQWQKVAHAKLVWVQYTQLFPPADASLSSLAYAIYDSMFQMKIVRFRNHTTHIASRPRIYYHVRLSSTHTELHSVSASLFR